MGPASPRKPVRNTKKRPRMVKRQQKAENIPVSVPKPMSPFQQHKMESNSPEYPRQTRFFCSQRGKKSEFLLRERNQGKGHRKDLSPE
jgi:hypothetical protein